MCPSLARGCPLFPTVFLKKENRPFLGWCKKESKAGAGGGRARWPQLGTSREEPGHMSTGGLALSPPAVLCAATRGREGTRGIYPPGSLPFPIHGTLVTPVVNAPHFCATWGCVECPVLHPAVGHSTRVSKLSQGDKLWVCSRCVLDRIRFNPQGVSPAARPFPSFSGRGNMA